MLADNYAMRFTQWLGIEGFVVLIVGLLIINILVNLNNKNKGK